MQIARLSDTALEEVWGEQDDSVRSRDGYPLHPGTGNAASSVVYFQIEPGKRLGRHRHTAEEVVLVLEGTAEVSVGEESAVLEPEQMALAPALAWHDVRNAGEGSLRCVGFFAAAGVQSVYEMPLEPSGSAVQGTPTPE